MDDKGKRREKRVPADNLPQEYRYFIILLKEGLEDRVQTKNMSRNGFGFWSRLGAENFIIGTPLVLYPLGKNHAVYGEIIHAQNTPQGTRVGINLKQVGAYEDYHSMFQSIITQL